MSADDYLELMQDRDEWRKKCDAQVSEIAALKAQLADMESEKIAAVKDIDLNQKDLNRVLEKHAVWLRGYSHGERADLRDANLGDADLRGADLRGADLRGADLRGAYLRDAYLGDAYLRGANLSHADLGGANLRGAYLRGANLSHADLGDADLRDANLGDADLRGATLWGVIGNMLQIKSLRLETYSITYTSEVLQIGCEQHVISDWWAFDDERIARMDHGALDWWRKWKEPLRQIIELSPAIPTGFKEQSKEVA